MQKLRVRRSSGGEPGEGSNEGYSREQRTARFYPQHLGYTSPRPA